MKPDYKPLYDKAKELIELTTEYLEIILHCGMEERGKRLPLINKKIIKLKSELHQLEAEIEKEEQPQPEKTAEEWLKKEYPLFWDDLGESGLSKKTILSIWEEYAAQFKSQSFQLSYEDIEDEAEEYSIKTFSNFNSVQEDIEQTFIDAIKWYRDQVQINLREELNDFLDFADPIYWGESEITDRRQLIDEYLKQK